MLGFLARASSCPSQVLPGNLWCRWRPGHLGYSNSGFCFPYHLWRRKLIGHDESFPLSLTPPASQTHLYLSAPTSPSQTHFYLSVPVVGGAGPWKSLKRALQKTGEQCVGQYYTDHIFLHCMAARLSSHSSHLRWSQSLLDGLSLP